MCTFCCRWVITEAQITLVATFSCPALPCQVTLIHLSTTPHRFCFEFRRTTLCKSTRGRRKMESGPQLYDCKTIRPVEQQSSHFPVCISHHHFLTINLLGYSTLSSQLLVIIDSFCLNSVPSDCVGNQIFCTETFVWIVSKWHSNLKRHNSMLGSCIQ